MTKDKIYNNYAVILDKYDLFMLGARSGADALLILRLKEQYFNDRLRVYKKVYLHEVYKELGISVDDKPWIESIGWRYEPENTSIDNYIDFGIFELANRDFINGCWNSVILDFNVDGIIN